MTDLELKDLVASLALRHQELVAAQRETARQQQEAARQQREVDRQLQETGRSNSTVNEAYVVEVKSHLREDGLEQIKKILQEFRRFFPEHASKRIYGILAAVDVPEDMREKVLREGIYLARIHDEEFEIDVPDDFKPRAF
jgi:RecB family endonuclease NucS